MSEQHPSNEDQPHAQDQERDDQAQVDHSRLSAEQLVEEREVLAEHAERVNR